MNFPIVYDEPVFRPPSEAYSLILQITIGCSWNNCAFCEMYTSKKFKARPEQEVFDEIRAVAAYGQDIRKVFLADGNPLVLSTKRLFNIISELNRAFPRLNRISTYALASDICAKSIEDLKKLREIGLKMIYIGVESGDNEVLGFMNKGETYETTKEGILKAREAGIKCSTILINGIGGKKYSEQHAINSAKLLNATQPEFASTLVLTFHKGLETFKLRYSGEYLPMHTKDLFEEMYTFISNTELSETIFRSNHASNYLVLSGILGRDKQMFLDQITTAINHPELSNLREEWQRGL
ncbi:MAG: radical SAM protein [Bacteroidetes bacterium]|nr:MAG: radical SAM protein [Bacteroidota bacterium]